MRVSLWRFWPPLEIKLLKRAARVSRGPVGRTDLELGCRRIRLVSWIAERYSRHGTYIRGWGAGMKLEKIKLTAILKGQKCSGEARSACDFLDSQPNILSVMRALTASPASCVIVDITCQGCTWGLKMTFTFPSYRGFWRSGLTVFSNVKANLALFFLDHKVIRAQHELNRTCIPERTNVIHYSTSKSQMLVRSMITSLTYGIRPLCEQHWDFQWWQEE